MKPSSITIPFVLILVARLAFGYHLGRRPVMQSKQAAENLLEKSDGYYWYYRNFWLPNYLAERGIQDTGRPITTGSSSPTNR